jgi:hypothetical protein
MPPDRHDVLLRKAKQDELVLERLLDDCDVDDDTLGFHAQQAAEKRRSIDSRRSEPCFGMTRCFHRAGRIV